MPKNIGDKGKRSKLKKKLAKSLHGLLKHLGLLPGSVASPAIVFKSGRK